jgi:hypothetical protein
LVVVLGRRLGPGVVTGRTTPTEVLGPFLLASSGCWPAGGVARAGFGWRVDVFCALFESGPFERAWLLEGRSLGSHTPTAQL